MNLFWSFLLNRCIHYESSQSFLFLCNLVAETQIKYTKANQGITQKNSCWPSGPGVHESNCLAFRSAFWFLSFSSLLASKPGPSKLQGCGCGHTLQPGAREPYWSAVQREPHNVSVHKMVNRIGSVLIIGWLHFFGWLDERGTLRGTGVIQGIWLWCGSHMSPCHGMILWRVTQWRHVTLTSQKDICADMEFSVALLLLWMTELGLVSEKAEARLLRKNILGTRADKPEQ